MSVSSPTARLSYVISSLPATLPVFEFDQSTDLLLLDGGASNTGRSPAVALQLGSDYTVTGGGYNSLNQLQPGSAVVVAGGVNSVVVGDVITVLRNISPVQNTSFDSTGLLTPLMIEQDDDRLTTIDQQIEDLLARTLRFQPNEAAQVPFPLAARIGKLLGFDSTGALFFYTLPTGVTQNGYFLTLVAGAVNAIAAGTTFYVNRVDTTGSSVMADFVFDTTSVGGDSGALRAVARQLVSGNSLIRAGEFQTLRGTGASASATWGIEIGVHSQVAGTDGKTYNVGAYIASSHTGWLPSGVRNDTGVLVLGEDGWNHGFLYLDTDNATPLFDIDQHGMATAFNTGSYYYKMSKTSGTARDWGIYITNGGNFGIDDITGAINALVIDTTLSLFMKGGIFSASPIKGVGYSAGAGGTVTQATDKSTTVVLNKVSGAITTTASTLNASTSVGFTVSNATVVSTDTVLINIGSGATANSYTVTVDAVGSGSFHVHLRNVSAGNLSEALVLNFTVIKGSTS